MNPQRGAAQRAEHPCKDLYTCLCSAHVINPSKALAVVRFVYFGFLSLLYLAFVVVVVVIVFFLVFGLPSVFQQPANCFLAACLMFPKLLRQ